MPDSRIHKWRRWCENEIRPEIMTIHLQRYIFREVGEIVASNASLPPSYYFDYTSDTYATTQAVAIRRQAEIGPRVITLARLISEIGGDASRMTRRYWIGMWDNSDPAQVTIANAAFTKQFAPGGRAHLDPAIPASDLARLANMARSVKVYVDQHVAHNDAKPGGGLPTFKDLDTTIDLIGELFAKYTNLLTAATWTTLVPVMQHDWKAVFRQAWIR